MQSMNRSGGILVVAGIGAVIERNSIGSATLQAAPTSRAIHLQHSRGVTP